MFTLKAIISFVVVLAVLIFVHELGHFLVARWCRVKVLTFAIGFGPTIWSRKRGDTEYALKAIPLGGYVKMYGEELEDEMTEADRKQTFAAKTVWQRMAIVFAGPLFNFLTAIVIFCSVFLWGVPVLTSQVGEVIKDSPAALAGLQAGDTLTSIGGVPVSTWEQVPQKIQTAGGAAVEIIVDRNGTSETLLLTPELADAENIFGEPTQVWRIGITPDGSLLVQRHNPLTAIGLGLERTYEVTRLTVLGIVKLIQGIIPGDAIGGPVLIAQMAGQQAEAGFLNILLFVALLSINLGVLNLLPIPVLDGGHLAFLSAEAVMGRPVSIRVREVAQQAGLFALLALMAFAFYNDIMRVFAGSS